ncbi:hypothetical protein ACFQ4D_12895 [Oceanobacillus profundus]
MRLKDIFIKHSTAYLPTVFTHVKAYFINVSNISENIFFSSRLHQNCDEGISCIEENGRKALNQMKSLG